MRKAMLFCLVLLLNAGCVSHAGRRRIVPPARGQVYRYHGIHRDGSCVVDHSTLDAKTGAEDVWCQP